MSSVNKNGTVDPSTELYYYRRYKDGVVITRYMGRETHVVIPERIGDGRVVAIGVSAFAVKEISTPWGREFFSREEIVSVRIPDSVREIGTGAFFGCESLRRINVPASLEIIGGNVFTSCFELYDIIFPQGITRFQGSPCEVVWKGLYRPKRHGLYKLKYRNLYVADIGPVLLSSIVKYLSAAAFEGSELCDELSSRRSEIVELALSFDDALCLERLFSVLNGLSLDELTEYISSSYGTDAVRCRTFMLEYKYFHYNAEEALDVGEL